MQRAFRNESEARAFDAEQQQAVSEEDDRLSMGELVVLYLRSRRDDLHKQTRSSLTWLFLDGSPAGFLRDKYAEALTRQDLERMRESLRERNVTNNTINHYQAYIRAVLAWGVDQDLIRINPWRDYKRLKTKKLIITATISDLQKIYRELPDYLRWAVKTAFFLALRPGQVELFSLQWNSFNWRRNVVSVRQGKSGRVKNVFPPLPYLNEAYTRYVADRDRGIVLVCHRDGMRILSCRTAWLAACRRAGVKMRPYDIRHIAASTMLANGAELAAVAAQMGHASVITTGTTYAHVTPGGQSHAASLMPTIDVTDSGENAPS